MELQLTRIISPSSFTPLIQIIDKETKEVVVSFNLERFTDIKFKDAVVSSQFDVLSDEETIRDMEILYKQSNPDIDPQKITEAFKLFKTHYLNQRQQEKNNE